MKTNSGWTWRSQHCLRNTAFVFALLAVIALGAPVYADDTAIKANPSISSASEIDYPPFCLVDSEGQAAGFSVELMRAALKAMGRTVDFRTGPWANVKEWLDRGEVQALPLVGRTPEREALYDFTFPYMSLHGAIVVRNETNDVRELSDLKGRQVAVMKGDNAEEFLRREDRGIDIHTTLTFQNALKELSEGQYDAVVIQRLVALRLIREIGLKNLKVINTPIEGFRQDFCFAVKRGDRDTLALLNEGLALVMADGTYRHLHAKWFAAMELPTNRRIVIGGDSNYPPFEYLDKNGRPAGYNVDLTRAIARETGLDIEIRLGPWAQVVQDLEKGDIDAIQRMSYSTDRDLKFDFSPAHVVNHCVSVIRKGDGDPPASLAELSGKRIVVRRGDIMHDWLIENGLGDQVTVFDAQEDVLRALAQGQFDCALGSRLSALYWIKKQGLDNLIVGRHPFLSNGYCYAVQQNEKALLASLSEGLKTLEVNGEFRRIYEKWMGIYDDSRPSLAAMLRYIVIGAVPLILILVASFVWSWSLRKQVARRTDAFRESERRLATLMGNLPGMAYRCRHDSAWTMEFASEGCLELTGYPVEDLVQKKSVTYGQVIHPDDRQSVWDGIEESVAAGSPFTLEYRIISKDGGVKWVWEKGRSVPAGPGREESLEGFITDITEFKLAQKRIEHLNDVLRAIRDVNQLIVRERNREMLIRGGCRLLVESRGYDSALIVLTNEDDRPVSWAESGLGETFAPMASLLEQGILPACCQCLRPAVNVALVNDRASICGRCPIRDIYPDRDSLCAGLVHEGELFGYLIVSMERGLSFEAEEWNLFSEMADDLAFALNVLRLDEARLASERKSEVLQSQLLQAQKMEAVGRLAGGVAHDFNNMLNVIIGYAELAIEKMEPSDPLYAHFKEILAAAGRSAGITRQLLAFARKQTISPKILDLNKFLQGMLKMLRRLIGEDIDLAWLPGTRLWPVKIDPAQLDQILANLCLNARKAISNVGRITIETENVFIDGAQFIDHAELISGEFVLLAVSDDGCGMDKATIDNIFEPFYTTRGLGHGTGLGLSTVYGIVKQNSGFIDVYSEPGQGSTFKIYLPRHAGAAQELADGSTPEVPHGQGETVLLVEDELPILTVTEAMLERLGYRILSASTPKEAMQLAAKHADAIQLLITDVVMPGMNGRDLSIQMSVLNPGIKTLFMSGYTADVIAYHGVLDDGVNFIQKPFSLKDMAGKVREVLDR